MAVSGDVPPTDDAVEQAIASVFGDRAPVARQYARLLAEQGVLRGLIGPREVDRLWDRHVLNCALVGDLIEADASVIDVGSGAGLPGLVLAIRRPDLRLTLVESMARRVQWLTDASEALGLENVVVRHGRAEDLNGIIHADVVIARAVAPLVQLLPWCLPLIRPGGTLLALKGARAEREIQDAQESLHALGCASPELVELGAAEMPWCTRVVRVRPGTSAVRGRFTRRRGRSR
ncbi:MAG TPA: 16S rRNA (guanine(527)-N(7))-methyltransferase RsmG [Dermatophilaceae bacterium]|nr:16S rRNA (guanine(527)-N(7))-methyltransferase RsmG [Dermatophilaceae bacterium]